MKQLFFFLVIIALAACSGSARKSAPGELQKVSAFSNDSVIAATYFSSDTSWAELAKALWKEKTKLMEGKDSTTLYYLFVFNDPERTPDITRDYDIAWNQDFMHYRSCTLDNGFGFIRFCYGIRYDDGRVGDWKHFRYVNEDGSLAEEQ